jgi:hypothetical protein
MPLLIPPITFYFLNLAEEPSFKPSADPYLASVTPTAPYEDAPTYNNSTTTTPMATATATTVTTYQAPPTANATTVSTSSANFQHLGR